MILGSLKLHSAVDGHSEVLLGIRITNDGTGSAEVGNYDWHLMSKNGTVFKSGHIEGWHRMRKTPGQLLAEVMRQAYSSL